MGHFVYVPSQWGTMLHFNIASHWLGTYTKWFLRVLWQCSGYICILTLINWYQLIGAWEMQQYHWECNFQMYLADSWVYPGNLIGDKSVWIQVMTWCHQQATGYCLSQCWPRSVLTYDITRPRVDLQGSIDTKLLYGSSSVILCVPIKFYFAWVVMAIDQPTSIGLMEPWAHKDVLNDWWASLTACLSKTMSWNFLTFLNGHGCTFDTW